MSTIFDSSTTYNLTRVVTGVFDLTGSDSFIITISLQSLTSHKPWPVEGLSIQVKTVFLKTDYFRFAHSGTIADAAGLAQISGFVEYGRSERQASEWGSAGIVSAWTENLSSQLVLHSAAYGVAVPDPQLLLD